MKEEQKIGQLVGKIGNEYYFLDKVFQHDKDFKGATGSIMSPMTQEEYEQRVEDYFDPENMRDFWQESVKSGNTELGLEEWIKYVEDTDGENGVIDRSYPEYADILREKLGEDFAFEVECVGGGRCFVKNMKFDKVYNQKLIDLINQYEEEEKN